MVNKFLLELSRGTWLMAPGHADSWLPIIAKILKGEDLNMERSPIHMQLMMASGGVKTKTIKADTWVEDPENLFEDLKEPATLVIPVEGVITKYDNCGYYGAQTYARVLDLAASNKNIKSVVLKMDTPGGSADGSFDFAEAVGRFAKSKTIVAYADGLMASAGYRVAARASEIVAKPGSIIGSIGTMVTLYDYAEYFKSKGITEHRIYATGSPDKNSDYEEAMKGNYDQIRKQILDPINKLFLQEMRDARDLPEAALTGSVYDPIEAKKLKMIDKTGTLADALKAAGKPHSTTSNSKSTNMNLGKSILAFLGLTAQPDQLTQEQIDKLDGMAGENARLTAELATAKTDLQTAKDANATAIAKQGEQATKITELEEKVKTLSEENVKLGGKPGAGPTKVAKDGDEFEEVEADARWGKSLKNAKKKADAQQEKTK